MKTIVIAGGRSGIGKSTLAKELVGILPNSIHVKIGHHPQSSAKHNLFFPMNTVFQDILPHVNNFRFIIIESNSILETHNPDCTIFLPSKDQKPSAEVAFKKADIIRGHRITKKQLTTIAQRLDISDEVMTRVAWTTGARPEPATAIILAGGKSSRMGTDKAMLDVHGILMIDHICSQLAPLFDSVIISSQDPDFSRAGMTVVKDLFPDNGPIGGIEAALRASTTERNFITTCDIPTIHTQLICNLMANLENCDISLFSFKQTNPEPLFAGYRKKVGIIALEQIKNKKLKLSDLFDKCQIQKVMHDDKSWYFNMNTPDEYRRFLIHTTSQNNQPIENKS
jgi:molybdopterin-guanine dinucleotide biosynthesis protein A